MAITGYELPNSFNTYSWRNWSLNKTNHWAVGILVGICVPGIRALCGHAAFYVYPAVRTSAWPSSAELRTSAPFLTSPPQQRPKPLQKQKDKVILWGVQAFYDCARCSTWKVVSPGPGFISTIGTFVNFVFYAPTTLRNRHFNEIKGCDRSISGRTYPLFHTINNNNFLNKQSIFLGASPSPA